MLFQVMLLHSRTLLSTDRITSVTAFRATHKVCCWDELKAARARVPTAGLTAMRYGALSIVCFTGGLPSLQALRPTPPVSESLTWQSAMWTPLHGQCASTSSASMEWSQASLCC